MGTNSVDLYNAVVSDVNAFLPEVAGDVFDPYGEKMRRPDSSVAGIRVAALLKSLLSKFEDVVDIGADDAALAKFLECNDRCAEADKAPCSDLEATMLGEYTSSLDDFFLYYDAKEEAWYDLPVCQETIRAAARHGPGAAQGAKEQSAYAKHCSSKLTATSEFLLQMFEEDSFSFDTSGEAQLLRSIVYGEEIVDGNVLAFVPKKRTISRTTCTEAIVNMYYQLGLGSVFEQHLKTRYHIDFRGTIDDGVSRFMRGDPLFSRSRGKFVPSQAEFNGWLALKGSKDGSYATIDLVSASDTIAMRRLADCPPSVRRWVKALRSPVTRLPDGRVVQLNMVSTMGNGFTFALQTIFFSCAVRAVYRTLGIPFIKRSLAAKADYYETERGNWGVFGDDIVVVREAYRPLCRLLALLGFEVNLTKSFDDGPFRESCGSDWYNGAFVRGVYVSSLRTVQDKYVAFNRLADWSGWAGIPLFNSLKLIYGWIPPEKRFLIPLHENDDAGLKVPLALKEDLGKQVTCAPSDWGGYARHHLRSAPSTGADRYVCYRARDLTYDLSHVISAAISVRKHGKWRFLVHNPAGILWCALGNLLRDGAASSRLREPHYLKTAAFSSGWNFIPRQPGSFRPCAGSEDLFPLLEPVIGSTRS